MTLQAALQLILYFGVLLLITRPLGAYMAHVFCGERTFLHPALGGLERGAYRLLGVDPEEDMRWTTYAVAMLMFSLVTLLFKYAALRLQGFLPLNPQDLGSAQMPPQLAFNTAVSFATNTNWQSYSLEPTVSYFSNMVALAIHNWASAAVGLAIAMAVVRGCARKNSGGIGNFWADVVRATLYVLLPMCLVGGYPVPRHGRAADAYGLGARTPPCGAAVHRAFGIRRPNATSRTACFGGAAHRRDK